MGLLYLYMLIFTLTLSLVYTDIYFSHKIAQLFDTEYYLLAVAASILALKLIVAPFLFP